MKKFILLSTFLSFLFSAGAFAGEQDTIWSKALSGVTNAFFTPDDQSIITNRINQIVELDFESGELIRESKNIRSSFHEFELSYSGNYIFILHFNQDYASLVNYSDFSIKQAINLKDSNWLPHSIAISADDNNLAIGVHDLVKKVNYILVYDSETGKLIKRLESSQVTRDLKYSPDGKYLAAISAAYDFQDYPDDPKYYLHLYDAKTYEFIRTLDYTKSHTEKIISVNFNKTGTLLLESCENINSKIWNLEDFDIFKEYSFNNFTCFMGLNSNNKYTVTASVDISSLKLHFFDNDLNKLVSMYPYRISKFSISNNDDLIICAATGGLYLLIPYWKMTDVPSDYELISYNVDYKNTILNIEYEVSMPEQTEINLFDNTGIKIKSIFTGLSREGLNVIEEQLKLASGIYHLQMKIGEKELFEKFIVVN